MVANLCISSHLSFCGQYHCRELGRQFFLFNLKLMQDWQMLHNGKFLHDPYYSIQESVILFYDVFNKERILLHSYCFSLNYYYADTSLTDG